MTRESMLSRFARPADGEADRLDVAIVILHYESLDDTERCVRSLELITHRNVGAILVDNASPTRPLPREADWLSGCDIVRNARNLGFAGGVNVGIARASELGARHVLLLNSDTEIRDGGFLTSLVDALHASARAGAAGPLVMDGFSQDIQDTRLAPVALRIRDRGRIKLGSLDTDVGVQTVWGISGVCMLLPIHVLNEIGLLDDKLFMYGEDTDLCFRLQRAGYQVILDDTIGITHFQRSTRLKSLGAMRSRMYYPNKIYVLRKYGGTSPSIALNLGAFLWMILRGVGAAIFSRRLRSEWRFVPDLLSRLRWALRTPVAR